MLMVRKELRLPDQLGCHLPFTESRPTSQCVLEKLRMLDKAHGLLLEVQHVMRQADQKEPFPYALGE